MDVCNKRRASGVLKNAIFAALISGVFGCGGGGGHSSGSNVASPDSVNGDGNQSGGDTAGQAGVNGDLKGIIYYDDLTGEHLKLNLVTGIESKMSDVSSHWEAFSKGVTDYDIDKAHQRFVITRSLSLWHLGPDQIQIYSLDKDYNLINNFVMEGHFVDSFHVSPNGKYVSMIWKSEWDGPTYFSIFDISGNELLEIYKNECSACPDHVWKQDGSGLILVVANSMHFMYIGKL